MIRLPSPSYSITIRAEIENWIDTVQTKIEAAISKVGGDLSAIDSIHDDKGKIIINIIVDACDEKHQKKIVNSVRKINGIKIIGIQDETFAIHEGGKIKIHSKVPVRDTNALSRVYTPGVARICKDIHKNKKHAYRYTIKGNSVAIVTDGTAVLGLGDIGPEAAMPVMEGKAMIFKEFAGIDAFPIALDTKDTEEIINTVKHIAPAFGGINLEDISAPRCFNIEASLRKELDIPVFHDDQHGTAIVVLAALINVSRLLKKNMKKWKIVVVGAGAAGTATTKILADYGVKDITVCDKYGTLYAGRKEDMNPYNRALAKMTNPRKIKGTISDAMKGADVFIGLSAPNIITPDDIKKMSRDRVVFALANPDPEIVPEEAFSIVSILATGRSDYPNQINNALVFPGVFRGLLDAKARSVNEDVEFAAAKAIAYTIKDDELQPDYIMPSIFDRKVVESVAHAVAQTAKNTGIA